MKLINKMIIMLCLSLSTTMLRAGDEEIASELATTENTENQLEVPSLVDETAYEVSAPTKNMANGKIYEAVKEPGTIEEETESEEDEEWVAQDTDSSQFADEEFNDDVKMATHDKLYEEIGDEATDDGNDVQDWTSGDADELSLESMVPDDNEDDEIEEKVVCTSMAAVPAAKKTWRDYIFGWFSPMKMA